MQFNCAYPIQLYDFFCFFSIYLFNSLFHLNLNFEKVFKVEKILNCNLDAILSPSVKIQIMDGKICLMCKGKLLMGVVNKLLRTKSLLTLPSNVLPYYLN